MTRRGVMGLLGMAAALMLLSGCALFGYPSASVRYRMMVAVETPRGLVTGSSVIETTTNTDIPLGSVVGVYHDLKGEAVVVDIAPGQTLFALLQGGDGSDAEGYHARLMNQALNLGAEASPPLPRRYKASEWIEERRAARLIKPEILLPPQKYPMLVRFRDIADPKSVERVDPGDLAKSFGAGVRLKAITLSVTDDPVTSGIERRLGWLGDGKIMNNPGWAALPYESRVVINGLYSGTIRRKE